MAGFVDVGGAVYGSFEFTVPRRGTNFPSSITKQFPISFSYLRASISSKSPVWR